MQACRKLTDYLFSLRQALKMYDAIQERISDYEKEILQKVAEMQREFSARVRKVRW